MRGWTLTDQRNARALRGAARRRPRAAIGSRCSTSTVSSRWTVSEQVLARARAPRSSEDVRAVDLLRDGVSSTSLIGLPVTQIAARVDALARAGCRGCRSVYGIKHVAGVVDHAPVDLLRHAVVVAAVARPPCGRRECRAAWRRSRRARCWCRRGRAARSGRSVEEHRVDRRRGSARPARRTPSPLDPEVAVGRPHAELLEEDVAERRVVVLAGVDEHVVARWRRAAR